MRLTEAATAAIKAMAATVIERGRRRPRHVYLGEGIWWTPSERFWRSRAGRRLLSEEGRDG